MFIFRLVFGLLLIVSLVCFAMFVATNQPLWKRRGLIVFKWTIIAALGFFAVLILERVVPML
jgi:hypothetical protein